MIKERIIQLIENKGIAKEEFYVKIGMTSASFRGSAKYTPLNSTAIENIISLIPDVNTDWLLTGKGDMLKDNQKSDLSVGIMYDSFMKSSEKMVNAVKEIANTNNTLADTNAKLADTNQKLVERILELTEKGAVAGAKGVAPKEARG